MAKGKKVKKKFTSQTQSKTAYSAFFVGLFLCGTSIFLLLSFLTADITLDPINGGNYCSTGLIGSWLAYGVVLSFGKISSFFLAFLVFLWGSVVMKRGKIFGTWVNVLGGVLMLFSVSIMSGLLGSGDFYSGGLLSEIVLPYANLYGGGLGVFMMSSVIFVTGMILAFGTKVFSVAEWIGEIIVRILFASFRGAAKVCKEGKESFTPRVKRAMLTAGAGVAAPMREATKSAKNRYAERVERTAAKRKEVVDEEEESGVIVDAEIVDEEIVDENVKAISEPETARERVIINRETAFEGNSEKFECETADTNDPVVDIIDESGHESSVGDSYMDELVVDNMTEACFDSEADGLGSVDFSEEAENNPYATLAAKEAAKKAREEVEELKNLTKISEGNSSSHPYKLPSLELLDAVPERKGGNPAALAKRAKILESLLADFKIQGQVVHIERGPRITQFEISLAPGIKLSRVSGLQDNIAMVLKAPSIRIIAPIPGKDTIGIEIPNIDQELVCLKEVVEAVDINNRKQALPLCLAKDVSGKPIIADLAKMPHLLIAGATGSGKSVCINSIIMSFLTCLRYDECKLIMVDPKVVELSRFRDIPHLMSPVITDMQKAVGVLEWACQEMDQRYEKLSMVSVNNLAKFNALSSEEIERRVTNVYGEEELEHFPRKLPYIVIIIDELADLMMVAKKDVENHIARLAAKSRAVGIHLILATQRPSTDVITGLIKQICLHVLHSKYQVRLIAVLFLIRWELNHCLDRVICFTYLQE